MHYRRRSSSAKKVKYKATWESLATVNQTPDWFLDANFGIYTHWGPVSEAMYGADPTKRYRGWHGMIMYQDGKIVPTPNGEPSTSYEHHIKNMVIPLNLVIKPLLSSLNLRALMPKYGQTCLPNPVQNLQDRWAKIKEYIDTYQPDLIWFDWWLENLDDELRKIFLAYYYNQGVKWEKR